MDVIGAGVVPVVAVEGEAPGDPPALRAHSRWAVRESLRRHTHRNHVRLNAHPLVANITRPGFSLEAYRVLLSAYHRFYRWLEPRLAEGLTCYGLPLWYEDRRRTPWLAADLSYLGIVPKAGPTPAEQGLSVGLSSPGGVIGALYVIEGSSLGGAFIARQLAQNLGITADSGGRFFHGYGRDTEMRWEEFCRFAERIVDDPIEVYRAQQAAAQVFEAIEALLDGCIVPRDA
jgi:heme oxygenase